MTDESRTPEPQPPGNRSTDIDIVGGVGGIVGGIVSIVVVGGVVGDEGISGSVVGGVVLSIVGIVVGIVIVVLNPPTPITFVDNAVRGVSRLRLTLRRTGVAAPFAVAVWIGGRNRRWQAEPWEVDLTTSPRPIRYGLGLVVAATRMRLYDLGGLLVKAARWVLASNRRTWGPLAPLLTFAAVNIHLSQGWGSAFYTLPTIVGFHLGVEWLRHRWGIEVKPKLSAGDPGGDQ